MIPYGEDYWKECDVRKVVDGEILDWGDCKHSSGASQWGLRDNSTYMIL